MNDPSEIRNNANVDFNDENLGNVQFVEVKSLPSVREQLQPKMYDDNAIGEAKLVRTYRNSNFEKNEQSDIAHTILNIDPANNFHAKRKN